MNTSPVRVDWDRKPVSIHHENSDIIESLLIYLKNSHGVSRHSIVMQDRVGGGFVAFIYQVCNPEWILAWQKNRGV